MPPPSILTGTDNPILRQVSEEVDITTTDLPALKKTLLCALSNDKNGVGLAAPQIGILKRAILVTLREKDILFMANPVITSFSAETEIDEEGCLSVPGEFGKVARAAHVTVEYYDEHGKKQKKNLSHFEARIVQHEIDHLNGILFVDRLMHETPLFEGKSVF